MFFIIYSIAIWDIENPNCKNKNRIYGIILSGLSVIFRPTSVIFLIFIYLYHFIIIKDKIKFIIQLLCIASLILIIQILIDSYFYNKFVITIWNFLEFNFLENKSTMYGILPFYWYFIAALPFMCGGFILLIPLIIKYCDKTYLFYSAILMLCFYSLLGHKEYRFIYTVISIFMIYCGNVIYNLWIRYGKIIIKLLALIIIIHIIIFCYLSCCLKRGGIEVVNYLSYELLDKPDNTNVYFMIPCHETPYYSIINKNISMSFPTCEPFINNKNIEMNERDIMLNNPLSFIENKLKIQKPNYIITTESIYQHIFKWLEKNNYYEIYSTSKDFILQLDKDYNFIIFKL